MSALYCAAGDIHGALDRLYADVFAFEAALGDTFAHVLHVGDFGIWPEPDRLDRATRAHDGAGDFPRWFASRIAAPRPTIFIAGNHEDFEFLGTLRDDEVLPNLRFLRSGEATLLPGSVRVAGIGGCYGATDYDLPTKKLQGGARRHYTREQVERVGTHGRIDVLLLHDAPAGTKLARRLPSGTLQPYVSQAVGLGEAVARTRPKACFFGHHHQRVEAEVSGVRCIGLNAVGRPGNLVAFRIEEGACEIVGEWPAAI
jgi:Icc-related predicted phosphoesterase